MPITPTTPAIQGYIKALLETAVFSPALSDGSMSYKNINIGSIRDYNDQTPCAEIEARGDGTHRQALGGKIRDQTDFLIRSIVAYNAQANTAETDIAIVRDAATAIFHTHARLGQNEFTTGICDSRIKQGSAHFVYANRNGVWWRVHEFQVTVTMEYLVQIAP